MAPCKLFLTNPDRTKSALKQEEVSVSKKTLGIHNSPAGENKGHLKHIKEEATRWTSRMTNGHLPHLMAWVAYRQQLWLLQYGLGTMTSDIEEAESILQRQTTTC
jgi:hypothetical protein